MALVACGTALATVGSAQAQPAGPALVARDLRFAGGHGYRLQTVERAPGDVTVGLAPVGDDLRPTAASLELHHGADVRQALAVRKDAALAALIHGGAGAFVRFTVVPLDAQGALGTPKVLDASARRIGNDSVPTAVLACPDAQGFTVLWQELVLAGDRPDARTYFARVGADGSELEAAHVVEVPWALAALAANGRGYHVGLFYTAGSAEQTRLAMVTLDAHGKPEQHPWWASAPELITEVQLLKTDAGVAAYWRGGSDGTMLRSSDVTAVGQWGHEPGTATALGTIGVDDSFALQLDERRAVKVLR